MSNVIISGAFGLTVAVVTWFLAGYRDKQGFKRDMQRQRVQRLEELYANLIESLEMAIRVTKALGDYSDIERDFSHSSALLRLLSVETVILQFQKASDELETWSTLYRSGAPKKLGSTGLVTISSGDSIYSDRAAELLPTVLNELSLLVDAMALHLDKERGGL